MKIIDLLVKISKGEEVPKEIKFDGKLCSFDNEDKDYYCEEYGNILWYLVDTRNNMSEVLDTELEIIEEEKEIEFEDIKELGNNFTFENTNSELEVRDFEKSIISKKINSLIKNQKKIIDVINDMRDKE